MTMTIQATKKYDEQLDRVIENPELIEISVDGNTYPVKDEIKKHGFKWDDGKWVMVVTGVWFKANSFNFVRSVCKQFGISGRNLDIIGEAAKKAVANMDK